jgi:hypothetical protein
MNLNRPNQSIRAHLEFAIFNQFFGYDKALEMSF